MHHLQAPLFPLFSLHLLPCITTPFYIHTPTSPRICAFSQCCWYGVLHYAIELPLPTFKNSALCHLSPTLSLSFPSLSLLLILMTQLSEAAAVSLRSLPPADYTLHSWTVGLWTDSCSHSERYTFTVVGSFVFLHQRQLFTLSVSTLLSCYAEEWGQVCCAFVPLYCWLPPAATQRTSLPTRTRDGMLKDLTLWDLNPAHLPPAPWSWDPLASVWALGQMKVKSVHTRSPCPRSPSSCPSSSGCWKRPLRRCRVWRRQWTSYGVDATSAAARGAVEHLDSSRLKCRGMLEKKWDRIWQDKKC